MQNSYPILYSFRRCPYAMRARLAIHSSRIKVTLREISLRDKPAQMTKLSGKATVPVLVLENNKVIDESLDIMLWALGQSDPQNLLSEATYTESVSLIATNDDEFKPYMDKYKYSVRYPEQNEQYYRDQCLTYLENLNNRLKDQQYLLGNNRSIADIAIFPFIRQFASVDRSWFDQSHLQTLKRWLNNHINGDVFKIIMQKHDIWKDGHPPVIVYTDI